MFTFREKSKVHPSLKNYVSNYILNNEVIISDIRINDCSYFYTNKRLITLYGESIILNSNKVESYFYDDISSVKYDSHLVDSGTYITLDFKFVIDSKKLTLDFPEDIIIDISNNVDNFIS